MNEIEEWLRETVSSLNKRIPGGKSMRRLLVLILALVGGLMAYRWIKDNLAKLLEV